MAHPNHFFAASLLGAAVITTSSISAVNAADLDPPKFRGPIVERNGYVKVYGGAAFLGDEDYTGTATGPVFGPVTPGSEFSVAPDFGTGAFFGGSVGYRFPSISKSFTPRVEFDVNYLTADVENEPGPGVGSNFNNGDQQFEGDQSRLFLGANWLVEINHFREHKVVPYLGGGVGVTIVQSDVNYSPTANPAVNVEFDGTDVGVGYQAIGGIDYLFSESLSLNVEGRYVGSRNAEFERSFTTAPGPGLFGSADNNFDAVTVSGGLSYRF